MRKINWYKVIVHIGALVPIALVLWDVWRGDIGINPIQEYTLLTGWYALVLLILSLAITPLNSYLGWREVIPLRRLLGLYAFLYASIHFFIFVGLDYGFDFNLIWQNVLEKRFVLAGLAALLILIPLAVTSTKGWMRRLGKNWKRLHQGVYLASLLVIVHFVWLVKADIRRPLAYGAVVVFLLLLRTPWARQMGRKLRSRLTSRPKKQVVADGIQVAE
jgi:sulfoxide reductase heme-binding subunit YedZ